MHDVFVELWGGAVVSVVASAVSYVVPAAVVGTEVAVDVEVVLVIDIGVVAGVRSSRRWRRVNYFKRHVV